MKVLNINYNLYFAAWLLTRIIFTGISFQISFPYKVKNTYNLHFKSNVASTMPIKMTPTHDDIKIRSHESSKTVPKNSYMFYIQI